MEDTVELGKKRTSSVLDVEEDKNGQTSSKFGSRLLKEENDVFAHNAWFVQNNTEFYFIQSANNINRDHVDWDEEQEQMAKEKVSVQLDNPVPEEERGNQEQMFSRFAELKGLV
jgi:tRNAThr (cytosine32-N3)-methyltransferase